MEFRIEHKELIGFENTNFALDVIKLTKSAKNRSYPNLSNCCQTPLKQVKVCGECGSNIEDSKECTHKQFKLGKETYPISAEHLAKIKAQLDDDRIIVSEFRDKNEIPELYFTDVLFSSKQHKKYKKEYLEYAQILGSTGKAGIGMMNYRNRPYPVMIYAYQGHIVIRALHFHEEVDAMPMLDNQVDVNDTKINLLSQAMKINKSEKGFDIGQFTNVRAQLEEELVEKCINGEELPNVEKIEIKAAEDDDEIKRLQELLKQQQAQTPTPEAPKSPLLN